PHCQTYTDNLHQTRPILVRDLSICGQGVFLKVPRRQFICPHCGKYPTEGLEGIDIRRNYTKRYEEHIYEKVKELTIEQVSKAEQLSHKQVKIFFLNKPHFKKIYWEMPEKISMDEVSKEKGKRKFVTVISDVDKSSLLEVVNSHKSNEIIEELEKIPLEIRENVKEVSVDMWGGFPKVIQAIFPNAQIVIDRFQVMKLVNKSLNKIRLLLGFKDLENRNILLKNNADLIEEEMNKLQEILRESPCLKIAYELKEEFRDIYETSTTVKMGKRKMEKWLTHACLFFGKMSQTIKNHLTEICQYFVNGTTSGVMEGINNKIKLILRQSYGLKNFDLMREKLLACLFK
ncbi:MAG: ISL3 family transposase, partial [Moorea sp. SIO2B7]|nr:ISL3 family transposase [Moorena sp. SIO2B7]